MGVYTYMVFIHVHACMHVLARKHTRGHAGTRARGHAGTRACTYAPVGLSEVILVIILRKVLCTANSLCFKINLIYSKSLSQNMVFRLEQSYAYLIAERLSLY